MQFVCGLNPKELWPLSGFLLQKMPHRDHYDPHQGSNDYILFLAGLSNIHAFFEVPKRYYERDKELVEACDLLHAFLSHEDGFTGGTRFEVEYAVRRGIPVQIHWEGGGSYPMYQYPFPFIEGKRELFLAWEAFFHTTKLERRGGTS